MQVTMPGKDAPTSINYSIKNSLVRIDVNSARGPGAMIMDTKTRQLTILMPQQKMYMVQQMGENATPTALPDGTPIAHASARPNGSFTNTGIKEDILGYSCTKLLVTSDKGTAEIWVTDQLGDFAGLMQSGFGRRQAPPEWETALKGAGFFPMRVINTEKSGKVSKIDVTSVDKESLPDSLFSPPDGWRKFDMGAIMGGANPFGGGRPANGSN
jgi:hypothetical protein